MGGSGIDCQFCFIGFDAFCLHGHLLELPVPSDKGIDRLGLEKHPGADPDAFDLTVMEPSPEGRTGDPQGSQGLLYGEQPSNLATL